MIKISVASEDLDKQLALLRYYPEIVEKHFRPAIKDAAGKLKSGIQSQTPVDRGVARSSIKSSVKGKGVFLSATVGYGSKAWYMNVVEYGASPHQIDSYVPDLGVYVHEHPGFQGRFVVKGAVEQIEPQLMPAFYLANERVMNELAVK